MCVQCMHLYISVRLSHKIVVSQAYRKAPGKSDKASLIQLKLGTEVTGGWFDLLQSEQHCISLPPSAVPIDWVGVIAG